MKRLWLFSTIAVFAVLASSVMAVDNYNALKMVKTPTIDANLGEWKGVKGVSLTGSKTVTGKLDDKDMYNNWETLGKETWDNDADLSAVWYAAWDDNTFYFAAAVKDEKHENKGTKDSIWNGDCIQFTIDPTNAKTTYANAVYEYGYALTTKPEVWRWSTNTATKGETSKYAIVRDDKAGTTTYEVAIPKTDIAPADLTAGKVLGFSMIINENDISGGQGGWLGWGPHAIVYGKNADKTNNLTLSAGTISPVSPGGKLATSWGSMK
ncbi:hypothetical protein FJZ33_01175 [Candidatus Poribacteria bacterium]|nr:hypothetical protein [Candidatus Poribacteria bacterium]